MELKEQNERCGSVFILLVALRGEAIVPVRVGGWGDTLSGVKGMRGRPVGSTKDENRGSGETATCVLLQN